MNTVNHTNRQPKPTVLAFTVSTGLAACIVLAGCSIFGYSDESLFPKNVSSVRLEMFDNQTFPLRREIEFDLTREIAREFRRRTSYRVLDRDQADLVMTGTIRLGYSMRRPKCRPGRLIA